jgi:hypothetical protein
MSSGFFEKNSLGDYQRTYHKRNHKGFQKETKNEPLRYNSFRKINNIGIDSFDERKVLYVVPRCSLSKGDRIK